MISPLNWSEDGLAPIMLPQPETSFVCWRSGDYFYSFNHHPSSLPSLLDLPPSLVAEIKLRMHGVIQIDARRTNAMLRYYQQSR
ncbi:hypothetical protein [Marinococcus halotolerans]|uniref:hypothetical protein n=1 Tax=Marinococcus halotolerans TaxID=301092 RepID=UPI0012EC40A1|nr:hypothetical protein [Marinococcus halotolerans]